jgi:hypothetical protein
MRTTTTTTFEVSDVVRAQEPLPEVPYKQAVEALLTGGSPDWDDGWEDDEDEDDLTDDRPEPTQPRPVEACSRYHGHLVSRVDFHPFVAAVHRAFQDHRPLRISPDMIWLLVCQGVANHVNAHADQLRPRVVRHLEKLQIDVRRDDFVKGSPENPWPEVFSGFSAGVREHVGPAIDLFLPAFSTTGPAERAAAEVVLLDAVRSYFGYAFHTRCGIPAVTLEGTPEDWLSIAERAEAFAGFGLERWVGVLTPILRQFVRASQGDVDGAFWRSLYKLNDQSGGPVITGWVTAFFPYLKHHETGRATVPVGAFFGGGRMPPEEIRYPREGRRRGFAHGPTMEALPGGLSKAPFRWEYLGRTFDMEFLGGFVGVAQDQETLALRPEIGWAVREAGEAA